jgi:hypothetical protein
LGSQAQLGNQKKKQLPVGDIPLAKLELGIQVRSQAGAWGREAINAKTPLIHLTLTTDHWQLITA